MLDHFSLIRRQGFHFQQLRHAEHPIHGGADLMAHVGQELTLGDIRGIGGVPCLPEFLLLAFALADVAHEGNERFRFRIKARTHLDIDNPTVSSPVLRLKQFPTLPGDGLGMTRDVFRRMMKI